MQTTESKRGMARVAAVRHRRKIRYIMNNYGNYILAAAVAVVVIVCVSILAAVFSADGQTAAAEQTATAEPEEIRVIIIEQDKPEAEASIDDTYPFNIMSKDWGAEDLVGFKPYQIPQEYEADGGCFPDVMQKYTYIICQQAGVDYSKTLALIEIESGYHWDAVGDTADIGYMQIVPKWHKDRMERLNSQNMLDPFQNVRVGVDFLAELLEKYNGSYEKALTAYQYGASGAYKYWFSAGVDASPYAKEILKKAERIQAEMEGKSNAE